MPESTNCPLEPTSEPGQCGPSDDLKHKANEKGTLEPPPNRVVQSVIVVKPLPYSPFVDWIDSIKRLR